MEAEPRSRLIIRGAIFTEPILFAGIDELVLEGNTNLDLSSLPEASRAVLAELLPAES